MHVCDLPVKHIPSHTDQGKEYQKMNIYSDAVPAKLLLLNHETEDEDKPIIVIFSGCLAEKSASILIDNGASRNFIARKFMHWHQIVHDSEEVAKVLFGDGRQVYSQGNVNVKRKVQDYVIQQKLIAVELLADFDATLGDIWCRSNAIHLDFEHQECVLQREGERCMLHASMMFLNGDPTGPALAQKPDPTS